MLLIWMTPIAEGQSNIWYDYAYDSHFVLFCCGLVLCKMRHDDVIKWKLFPRNWPFVRGIHRSPMNSPHKGQRRGALVFSLIWAWINIWVNNDEAGDLRRHRAHYDVIVMGRFRRLVWCPYQGIASNTYQWLSARLQYPQCVSNGDTAVLH